MYKRFSLIFKMAMGLWGVVVNASANDFLLYQTFPIKIDQDFVTETYFRQQPNWYFFTIVYRVEQECVMKRYKTKITFNEKEAKQTHRDLHQWAIEEFLDRTYHREEMKEETLLICPFDPFDDSLEANDPSLPTSYIIFPGRGFVTIPPLRY
jgi:hypothetical protein